MLDEVAAECLNDEDDRVGCRVALVEPSLLMLPVLYEALLDVSSRSLLVVVVVVGAPIGSTCAEEWTVCDCVVRVGYDCCSCFR